VSVRSAIHVSVRSAVYAAAIILALVLLVIVVVLGAIIALTDRKRRPSFSYFALPDNTAKVNGDDHWP
jgi:hypothetical protein